MPSLDLILSPMSLLADAPPIAGVKSDAPAIETTPAPGSDASTGTPGPGPAGPMGGNPMTMFIVLAVVMVLMLWFSSRTQRKEAKRRQEMMSALSRSDRVQTLGGMIGTIVEIKDNEVVLRVDEATGTRITVAKSAVQSVLNKVRAEETVTA